MIQEICEHDKKSKSIDALISFLPLAVFAGGHSVISKQAFGLMEKSAAYALAVLATIVTYYLVYRFYLCSFRYSLAPAHKAGPFPPNTLTFERLVGNKARVYERVQMDEILALTAPGESLPLLAKEKSQSTSLTMLPSSSAHSLYYRRGGRLQRIYFHPTEELAGELRRAIR